MKKIQKILVCLCLALVMLATSSFGAVAGFLGAERSAEDFALSNEGVLSPGRNFSKSDALDALVEESIMLSGQEIGDKAVSVNGSRELTYFKGIRDKSVWSYNKISVSLKGKTIPDVAYLINETTYVPLRAAMTLAGAEVSFDNATRTAYVKMAGLNLSVKDGSYVATANDRPLMASTPAVILSDGKMYIPIRTLAKALGLSVEWLPPASVDLRGEVKPLSYAKNYYKSDEIYWLSRIISAEARGESLLGQIAVGNIVLNRMRSRDYPNTIYGVIFDKKYGVQFSPVLDGSIYREPTYSATQAAKICLEGVSVSPDILFFLNPTASSSSWIVKNRRYAFTVGNHYFFY